MCDSSCVDPYGLSTRATVVKGVSVRLLDLITDSKDLRVMCGDNGNTFTQANSKEYIYTRCGLEFGNYENSIDIIVRALYVTNFNLKWKKLLKGSPESYTDILDLIYSNLRAQDTGEKIRDSVTILSTTTCAKTGNDDENLSSTTSIASKRVPATCSQTTRKLYYTRPSTFRFENGSST